MLEFKQKFTTNYQQKLPSFKVINFFFEYFLRKTRKQILNQIKHLYKIIVSLEILNNFLYKKSFVMVNFLKNSKNIQI